MPRRASVHIPGPAYAAQQRAIQRAQIISAAKEAFSAVATVLALFAAIFCFVLCLIISA